MTVIEIVRLTAPEYKDMSDEDVEKYIELAKPWVSKKQFGKLYEQALAYFVCHKMKMAGNGESSLGEMASVANSFTATSVSDGGTSISFAGGMVGNLSTDAEFTMTPYGLQFLQLRKMCVVPITISVGCRR